MSMSKALLLVVADPSPTMEEEFNAWYDTEHVPERASIPGFNTALRFVSLGDGPAYMALYDLDALAVLDSPAYQAVYGVNFTPWTRRVTSRVNPARLTGVQMFPGQAITGVCARMVLVRLRDVSDADMAATIAALDGFSSRHSNCTQHRVFVCDQQTRQDGFVLFEFNDGHTDCVNGAVFGGLAGKIDLLAHYRPYRLN
jgi:hypothetical protein